MPGPVVETTVGGLPSVPCPAAHCGPARGSGGNRQRYPRAVHLTSRPAETEARSRQARPACCRGRVPSARTACRSRLAGASDGPADRNRLRPSQPRLIARAAQSPERRVHRGSERSGPGLARRLRALATDRVRALGAHGALRLLAVSPARGQISRPHACRVGLPRRPGPAASKGVQRGTGSSPPGLCAGHPRVWPNPLPRRASPARAASGRGHCSDRSDRVYGTARGTSAARLGHGTRPCASAPGASARVPGPRNDRTSRFSHHSGAPHRLAAARGVGRGTPRLPALAPFAARRNATAAPLDRCQHTGTMAAVDVAPPAASGFDTRRHGEVR